MTTAIADVRASLQSAIQTATGLRTFAYIQDQLSADVPVAHVVPMDMDPEFVFSGAKAVYPFQIRVYLSRAAAVEAAQKALDEYRDITGTKSILLAVQTSTNWTATIDYAKVTRIGEVTATEYGGVSYLMFDIDVEVCW